MTVLCVLGDWLAHPRHVSVLHAGLSLCRARQSRVAGPLRLAPQTGRRVTKTAFTPAVTRRHSRHRSSQVSQPSQVSQVVTAVTRFYRTRRTSQASEPSLARRDRPRRDAVEKKPRVQCDSRPTRAVSSDETMPGRRLQSGIAAVSQRRGQVVSARRRRVASNYPTQPFATPTWLSGTGIVLIEKVSQ